MLGSLVVAYPHHVLQSMFGLPFLRPCPAGNLNRSLVLGGGLAVFPWRVTMAYNSPAESCTRRCWERPNRFRLQRKKWTQKQRALNS